MRETPLGQDAYKKEIIVSVVTATLFIQQHQLRPGSVVAAVPIAAGLLSIILVMVMGRERVHGIESTSRLAAFLLVGFAVLYSAQLIQLLAENMQVYTFKSSAPSTLCAIIAGTIILAALPGALGVEGTSKMALWIIVFVLVAGIAGAAWHFDYTRLFPVLNAEPGGLVLAGAYWLPAYWPVALLWIFPGSSANRRLTKRSGYKGIFWGGIISAVLLIALLLNRSYVSGSASLSPVNLLFEVSRVGRSLYRLDPLLYIAMSVGAVATCSLVIHTAASVVIRHFKNVQIYPVVALLGAFSGIVAMGLGVPDIPLLKMVPFSCLALLILVYVVTVAKGNLIKEPVDEDE